MARVVVVGGGVGGLATGLFLAPRGHDVTILDSDPADVPDSAGNAWARWPRKGVPQFRHIHLFNARGRNLLRDEAPEVLAALRGAGAGEIRLDEADDDDLVRLTCRRTTYEMVLRRAVLSDPRVRFVGDTRVAGLRARRNRIVAVHTDGGTEWPADVVVDASGRRSRIAQWLTAVGLRAPAVVEEADGTVGHTRWYRLRTEPAADLLRADVGYAVGVVAPADGRMFCVTFGCVAGDPVMAAVRDTRAFDAAVAVIPPLAAWTDPERAEVQSEVLTMADRSNRLARLTADGAAVATGIVLLGDAAMCTNPGYGRGVGLALVHARGLAEVLQEVDDPAAVTTLFEEFTRKELEPWFHAAVAGDRVRQSIGRRIIAGEPWASIGAAGDDPTVRFARGAPYAAERDPVVRRALHRSFQLLDPPSEYWGSADIGARIDNVWRDLEGAPPPPPGPDYPTMGRLLAAAVQTV